MKNEYDLICSLGGNCAAAHNLLYRNLRKYSLPFDWCYIKSEQPIKYLCEGFENNFKNFFLKENLVELTGEEYNHAHNCMGQYKDTYSGYYFVNHFMHGETPDTAYDKVHTKLTRRLTRLQEKIKNGKNILFILSTCIEVDTDVVIELKRKLQELYTDKNFEFVIISFNCKNDEEYISDDTIYVKKYKRATNSYDFNVTNYEWNFLDNIKLNEPKNEKNIFKISKIKKGFKISILNFISTVFSIKLYLFGIRFNFCIGKEKNE